MQYAKYVNNMSNNMYNMQFSSHILIDKCNMHNMQKQCAENVQNMRQLFQYAQYAHLTLLISPFPISVWNGLISSTS
jgi:sialic acid synthase SpsE